MIAIGCDHGGFELKKYIIKKKGEENFKDYGSFSSSSCDYPDISFPLAKDVSKGICEKGDSGENPERHYPASRSSGTGSD